MRVLITGRDGQVVRSLAERGPEIDWVFAARPALNLADPGSFAAAIEGSRPDIVVNAAAYTAVDRAEDEEAIAQRVNAEAASEGAVAAAHLGIPFIQLSTDYVFDGSGTRAWSENDRVAPLGVYGRTKAEGERYVLAASGYHAVIRTSWLFSPFGHNFVKTMLRIAEDRNEVAVVDDQFGCPTNTLNLADGLIKFLALAASDGAGGIWHMAATGTATWADFAEAIFAASDRLGGPSAIVRRIATIDFPTRARRPSNSALDCGKLRDELGISLPPWESTVEPTVRRILGGE